MRALLAEHRRHAPIIGPDPDAQPRGLAFIAWRKAAFPPA
jgi:hypothetical protein